MKKKVNTQKRKTCDITVISILTGTWGHFTRRDWLARFLGIGVHNLDKFLSGEHPKCNVWKIIPYEDAKYKYTTYEKVAMAKFD